MSDLELKINGVYKKESGEIVRIINVKKEIGSGETVYLDELGYLYRPNGDIFHAVGRYGPIVSCIREADFEIEFGGIYVTQEGSVLKIIVAQDDRGTLRFTGDNTQTYFSNGEFAEGSRSLDKDSSRIISLATEKHINAAKFIDAIRFFGPNASKIFTELRLWGEKTFGDVTPKRIVERAKEELDNELLPKLSENDEWTPDTLEEAADIVVILTRAPGLWEAIERKMKINCERDWNLKGDGTGYHKTEGE